MHLEPRHIDVLAEAERLIDPVGFRSYLKLKELFPNPAPESRKSFRVLFSKFYALNSGGLTDEFKNRYFQILFGNQVIINGQPAIRPILLELSEIPRRKGDYALPLSFVSKLVATHQDTSPIYDRFVLEFFEATPPAPRISKEKRIDWFIDFLHTVAADYQSWMRNEQVDKILTKFKQRDARLAQCHTVRLMDFLIWTVGNKKLLRS